MDQIHDEEVRALAAIATSIREDYLDDDPAWLTSPFGWIKTRPSRQVGTIGEKLVAGWLAAKGFNVIRSPDSDADRIVENKRVEIKFSTLWRSGTYKFQQLRDQNYDLAICLGVSPFDAHAWILTKDQIRQQWGTGLPFQHGGSVGRDTVWLTIRPNQPQSWLIPTTGRLRDAVTELSEITGYTPTL